jgi:16S rRNA (adenine1518-N6/adenine1519-N6)-dimethyltransferase
MAQIKKVHQGLKRSRGLLARSGLRPRKSLGQHFLEDPALIETIISHAHFEPTDVVVEIGPGLGAITIPMLPQIHHLVAIEKDPLLIKVLSERLTPQEKQKITLVTEDVLNLDFGEIHDTFGRKLRVFGNLPYNISAPFLEHLIQNRRYIRNAILMFQYELARRLTASPNTRDYGALSVVLQYYARIEPLMRIERESFYPRPNVESMLLTFDFEKPHPSRAQNEQWFLRIVKAAFRFRRKTIRNSLERALAPATRQMIVRALEKSSIDPNRRAETLTIEEYIRLSSFLLPDTSSP